MPSEIIPPKVLFEKKIESLIILKSHFPILRMHKEFRSSRKKLKLEMTSFLNRVLQIHIVPCHISIVCVVVAVVSWVIRKNRRAVMWECTSPIHHVNGESARWNSLHIPGCIFDDTDANCNNAILHYNYDISIAVLIVPTILFRAHMTASIILCLARVAPLKWRVPAITTLLFHRELSRRPEQSGQPRSISQP